MWRVEFSERSVDAIGCVQPGDEDENEEDLKTSHSAENLKLRLVDGKRTQPIFVQEPGGGDGFLTHDQAVKLLGVVGSSLFLEQHTAIDGCGSHNDYESGATIWSAGMHRNVGWQFAQDWEGLDALEQEASKRLTASIEDADKESAVDASLVSFWPSLQANGAVLWHYLFSAEAVWADSDFRWAGYSQSVELTSEDTFPAYKRAAKVPKCVAAHITGKARKYLGWTTQVVDTAEWLDEGTPTQREFADEAL